MPHQAAAAGEAPAAQPLAAVTAGTARGGPAAGAPLPRRLHSAPQGGRGQPPPGRCRTRGNKAPARGGAGRRRAGQSRGWAGRRSPSLCSAPGRAAWGVIGPCSQRTPTAVPGAALPLAGRWGGRGRRCPRAIRPGGGCSRAIRGAGPERAAGGAGATRGGAAQRSGRLTVAVRCSSRLCAGLLVRGVR